MARGLGPTVPVTRKRSPRRGGGAESRVVLAAMTSSSSTTLPRFAYLTPRTLPPADKLAGRVAVLDIAFASEGGGSSFEQDDAAVHQRAGQPARGLGRPPRPRPARRLRGRSALRALDQGRARRLPRDGHARGRARRRPGRHGGGPPRSRRALLGRQVGAGRRRALRGRRRRRARRRHAPRRAGADRRRASIARCGRASATRRSSTASSSTWWRARRRRVLWEEIEVAAREIDPLLDECGASPSATGCADGRRLRRGGRARPTTRPSSCCSGRSARRWRWCATRAR